MTTFILAVSSYLFISSIIFFIRIETGRKLVRHNQLYSTDKYISKSIEMSLLFPVFIIIFLIEVIRSLINSYMHEYKITWKRLIKYFWEQD